ncbi:MAG: M55 family metallopeptidase [Victivallaceae bacterium]|nr:M55 family metallopeptidase [Victivallaceae bacterium]NLK82513.1 M55 family metallopeptidase [Lentisphaerota bacterium]MDD3116060.1 M55 family metallopeptidase [Victivallaceae bacterium]MDD3703872.1 M55 family metallopeptidase [Victivallaceae bacterium]MDD4317326.1 M55 family metallopeptidase [Victivallaceae bacterium]
MKIYVQTDIEGVAGFCFRENRSNQSYENIRHRYRMYRLLTGEVNAAVKAAFDAGATDVVVNDNHGTGYNIIFEELDPRCRIVHGRNCSGPHWLPFLDSSFDAMILIGMHAMGGTPKAIIPHSKWEVNDGQLYLSEGSMAAAIAGDFGVPTVMMSGDDKVAAEIGEKIIDIEQVVVKQAISPYQACSMIPARACAEIAEGVKRGLARRSSIAPYKIPGPVKLNLLDSISHAPPLIHQGETVTADSINEAFMNFERAMEWTEFDLENLVEGYSFP